SLAVGSTTGASLELLGEVSIAPPVSAGATLQLTNIDTTNAGTLTLVGGPGTPPSAEVTGGSFSNTGLFDVTYTVETDANGFVSGPRGRVSFVDNAFTNAGIVTFQDTSLEIDDGSAAFTAAGSLTVASTTTSSASAAECCGLLSFVNNSTGTIAGTADLSFLAINRGSAVQLETNLAVSGLEINTTTFSALPDPPLAASTLTGLADIEVRDSFSIIGGNLALDGTVTALPGAALSFGLTGPETNFSIDFPTVITGTTLRNESDGNPQSPFRNGIRQDLVLNDGATIENVGTLFIDSTYADRAALDLALGRQDPVQTRAPVLVSFSGDGTGSVVNSGFVASTNGTPFALDGVSLENAGELTLSGGLSGNAIGRLLNTGTVTASDALDLGVSTDQDGRLTAPSLTLAADRTLTTGADSETTIAGELAAAGTLDLDGGTLTVGLLSVSGILSGDGTITGNVENSGLVSPGSSAGALTVDGDYSQTALGRLLIEVGGTAGQAGTDFDALQITGSASFDGTLALETLDDFEGTLGSDFTPISYDSAQGTFAAIEQPANSAVVFEPVIGANGVETTVSAVDGQTGTIDPDDPPIPENEEQAREIAEVVIGACPEQRDEVAADNNTTRERENTDGDQGSRIEAPDEEAAPPGTQGVGCVTS
ncbi:MAG: hypothetical protein V2J24_03495, partial [Pseudomonadales bacterium]|nr:hypothetical protein [Pseudomonadales bacterium]